MLAFLCQGLYFASEPCLWRASLVGSSRLYCLLNHESGTTVLSYLQLAVTVARCDGVVGAQQVGGKAHRTDGCPTGVLRFYFCIAAVAI